MYRPWGWGVATTPAPSAEIFPETPPWLAGLGGTLINVPAPPNPTGTLVNVPAPPNPTGILINVPGPTGPSATDQGQLPAGIPLLDLGRNYAGATGQPGHLPADVPRPPGGKVEPPNLPTADILVANGQRFPTGNLPQQGGPSSGVLYKQDPQTGQITHYMLYDQNGNAIKRVDVTGRPHGGVPTPHVVYYKDNEAPELNEARDAVPEEVP